MNDRGVTLIELMVVLVIVGILAIAGAYEYQGWQSRYRVERDVKQVYSDIMNARALALSRSRMFFVNMPAADTKRYYVYEDTDGGSDGDGEQTAADKQITDNITEYELSPSIRLLGVNNKGLITNGTGILHGSEHIRFIMDSSIEPDYDCITLTSTRINMGLWDDSVSKCVER